MIASVSLRRDGADQTGVQIFGLILSDGKCGFSAIIAGN